MWHEQVSFLTWEFSATWWSGWSSKFVFAAFYNLHLFLKGSLEKLLRRSGNTQKRNLKINNDSAERSRVFTTSKSSHNGQRNLQKRWAISSGAAPSKPSWTSVCLKSTKSDGRWLTAPLPDLRIALHAVELFFKLVFLIFEIFSCIRV